jgi:hypothetical protein
MDPAARVLHRLHLLAAHRRRAAALESARRWGRRTLVVAMALLVPVLLGMLPAPAGPLGMVGLFLMLLVGGATTGAMLALRRVGGAVETARRLDAAAGWPELAEVALETSRRDGPRGRLCTAFLEDAAERIEREPLERLGPLPRPPWRLIGVVALIALLLGLLPQGGFGLLPGWRTGWGTGGSTGNRFTWGPADPDDGDRGRPREGGDDLKTDAETATSPGTDRGETGAVPPPPPPEPPPLEDDPGEAPAERLLDEFDAVPMEPVFAHNSPLPVVATARGAADASGTTPLELRVSVDGGPFRATMLRWTPRAGEPLRGVIDLALEGDTAAPLDAGEHTVSMQARDGAGRVVATSPPRPFRIQPPSGDGGGKGGSSAPDAPTPQPSPGPGESPPPESGEGPPPDPQPEPPPMQEPEPASPGGEPSPPPEEVPLDPSTFEDIVVVPLMGDGPEIVKRGPVLVPDPEGVHGDAPRSLPPEEILRRVRAAAEDASRREGVSAEDRDAVRRYFEALRRLLEGGR